jgi:hypothetical protein
LEVFMRVSGVLMVGVLIAAAFVLYLTSRDATESLDAVATVSADLREEGVAGRPLDRTAAQRMITAMEALVAAPDTISGHVDDLKSFTETAAAWAQAAASPSPELKAAVALRSAAGELREYSIHPTPTPLTKARRYLDDARAALAGEGVGEGPGLATDAVRDRLQNLQRSQQEQQQELAEELNR